MYLKHKIHSYKSIKHGTMNIMLFSNKKNYNFTLVRYTKIEIVCKIETSSMRFSHGTLN